MSVVDERGVRKELPRLGADPVWGQLQEGYAARDRRKWKYLAMLALRENAGWTLPAIAQVFGTHKGHVLRCLERVKQDVRDCFDIDAAMSPGQASDPASLDAD